MSPSKSEKLPNISTSTVLRHASGCPRYVACRPAFQVHLETPTHHRVAALADGCFRPRERRFVCTCAWKPTCMVSTIFARGRGQPTRLGFRDRDGARRSRGLGHSLRSTHAGLLIVLLRMWSWWSFGLRALECCARCFAACKSR